MTRQVIYKYTFNIVTDPEPYVLHGRFLTARVTVNILEVWCAQPAPPAKPTNPPRLFTIVGTGAPHPDSYEHLATVFDPPFVWHLMVIPA